MAGGSCGMTSVLISLWPQSHKQLCRDGEREGCLFITDTTSDSFVPAALENKSCFLFWRRFVACPVTTSSES